MRWNFLFKEKRMNNTRDIVDLEYRDPLSDDLGTIQDSGINVPILFIVMIVLFLISLLAVAALQLVF
jgi:hypothetical protein